MFSFVIRASIIQNLCCHYCSSISLDLRSSSELATSSCFIFCEAFCRQKSQWDSVHLPNFCRLCYMERSDITESISFEKQAFYKLNLTLH